MPRSTLFALFFALACGDDGAVEPRGVDGGADRRDAAAQDAAGGGTDGGAAADGGPGPVTQSEGFRADPSRVGAEDPGAGLEADAALLTCRDGRDNDRADGAMGDGADCDDPQCLALGVCCVGRADCCVADLDPPTLATEYTFTGCLELGTCAADARPYGRGVEPSADGLFLRGDETDVGGLEFGRPVDLRSHAVALGVTFRAPRGCEGSCLETLSLGLRAAGDGLPLVRVDYGAMRGGFVLTVRGRQIAFVSSAPGETQVAELTLEPTGDLVFAGVRYPAAFVPEPAQIVLEGRGRNPDGGDALSPIAVRNVEVATELCDIPSAWTDRVALREGTRPSVGHDGERTRLAWMDNGAVHLADLREGALGDERTLPSEEGVRYDDPEIVFEDGGWSLYLTRRQEELGVEVVRRRETGDTFELPEVVRTGVRLVRVSRSRPSDGPGERVLLTANEDGDLEVFAGGRTLDAVDLAPLLARATSPDACALAVVNGAWHLHVAERAGTRVSLRLFVSDELVHWRDLGEVLTGDGQGFDALGTDLPASVWTPEGLRLVYVGVDGGSPVLGTLLRAAPP